MLLDGGDAAGEEAGVVEELFAGFFGHGRRERAAIEEPFHDAVHPGGDEGGMVDAVER